MTSRFPFPRASFVGFDSLMEDLQSAFQHGEDNYPPHNVVKVSDNHYQIEIALAGFIREELSVEVDERTLTVSGTHISKNREFIHRGISTKKFKRTFRLSEYVEVTGASFDNGLLVVDLRVIVPEEKQPRKISIDRGKNDEKRLKGYDESPGEESQTLYG